MKITVVDVFVVILLGLSLYSFYAKYDPAHELGYSGSEIVEVVQKCDTLDSAGFLYTLYVRGYWNFDVGHFEEEAFVCDTEKDYLVLVLKDGRTVTVGKRLSYKEDIQATNVELHIKSKSSVIYFLRPAAGSQQELINYIEKSPGFINYSKEDIAVTTIFTVDTDVNPSILLESEIEHELRRKIFFMKKVDVEIDNGVTVFVEKLSMKEVEKVFEVLEKYVNIKDIYTGDIKVFYQTAQEIDVEDIPILESYEGNGVYQVSVYVRV